MLKHHHFLRLFGFFLVIIGVVMTTTLVKTLSDAHAEPEPFKLTIQRSNPAAVIYAFQLPREMSDDAVTALANNQLAYEYYDQHKNDSAPATQSGAVVNKLISFDAHEGYHYLIYEERRNGPEDYIFPTLVDLTEKNKYQNNPALLTGENYLTIAPKVEIIKTGSASFVKVDGLTNQPLAGAEFDLYTYDSNQLDKITNFRNPNKQFAEKVNRVSLISDKHGMVLSPLDLPFGSYYFIETNAPKPYVASNQPITFTIDKNAPNWNDSSAIPNYHEPTVKKTVDQSSFEFSYADTTKQWTIDVDLQQPMQNLTTFKISDNYGANWWLINGSQRIVATLADGTTRTLEATRDYAEIITESKTATNGIVWNFRQKNANVIRGANLANIAKLHITYQTKPTPANKYPDFAWYMHPGVFNNTVTVTFDAGNAPQNFSAVAQAWTGGLHFMKTDNAKPRHPLNGATFRVYQVTKKSAILYLRYLKVGANPRARVTWTTAKHLATKLKSGDGWPEQDSATDKTGKFSVTGLAAGDYFIEEIKAPSKIYKPLTQPELFTIDEQSWHQSALKPLTIVNPLVTQWPGTGGDEPTKPSTPTKKQPLIVIPLPGGNTFPVTGGMAISGLLMLIGTLIITLAIRLTKRTKETEVR